MTFTRGVDKSRAESIVAGSKMSRRFHQKLWSWPAWGLAFLVVAVASCPAVVVNWDTLTWSPGTLSNSYDVDPGNAGNDVTITISGTTSAFVSGYPQLTKNQTGGLSPAEFGLQLNLDFGHDTDTITVTVTFSAGYIFGVDSAVFALVDVDKDGGHYVDQITALHANYYTGTDFGPPTIQHMADNTVTGSGASQVITGTALADDASNAGNASVDFGTNILTSFTFTLGNDPSAGANPKPQSITFHDFSYRPKPIPELHPGLAAAAGCLLLVITRRLRLVACLAA